MCILHVSVMYVCMDHACQCCVYALRVCTARVHWVSLLNVCGFQLFRRGACWVTGSVRPS
uniref:Uncharacterized protein n=1 Tax=Anguilla anguilla TaxID=7936 RepID=A0A0E9WJQ2_ANGAN